jgi:hypothetical protein
VAVSEKTAAYGRAPIINLSVLQAESLQTQIDQTRDYYKGQVEQLHRELGDLLSTHRSVKVRPRSQRELVCLT